MSDQQGPYLSVASQHLRSAEEPATSPTSMAGRTIIVDAYHRQLFGEHLLKGAHEIFEDLTAVPDSGAQPRLAILDTRPETWISTTEAAFTDYDCESLVIGTAQHPLVVIETLAEAELPMLTVEVLASRRGRFFTGLRRSSPGDTSIGPLLAGLRCGLEPSLLAARDELVAAPAKREAEQARQLHARHQLSRLEDQLRHSQEQLRQAQEQLQSREEQSRVLQQRYQNLSSSLLGRLTLRYWAFRRRLRS